MSSPISSEFQSDFSVADGLFRNGERRRSITLYRKALRFEKDAFVRAKAYLELVRIYRIAVRMKNARLELIRAFEAAGLELPRNSWLAVLAALLRPDPLSRCHPDLTRKPRVERIRFVAEVYEELGLSAYYLRQIPVLLQSIIKTRLVCQELGFSRPLLNWYGGAACVFGLMGLRRRSEVLIQRCLEVAAGLRSSADTGKALIWHALLSDYNGDPVRSAELFESCLASHGAELYPFDLRLCAVTLSINYLSRGHYNEALRALSRAAELSPYLGSQGDNWSLDSAAWYTLAPKAMLAPAEENESYERIVRTFRSVMSVDKDEKWLLAQFLGHLLIAGRRKGMDSEEAEDLIRRFEILGMSADKTHFEASFYWVAAAYVRYDFALRTRDRGARARFRRALRMLGRTPSHPTTRNHRNVLLAGLARMEGKSHRFQKLRAGAFAEAERIRNRWALLELDRMGGPHESS